MISFKQVTKVYHQGDCDSCILDNVSIDFEGVNCIVGFSGSGKSTLLSIAGLIEYVDSGEVIINGVSASPKDTDLRARMTGFVFQKHKLINDLTVLDNVALTCMINKIDKPFDAAKNALSMLDLDAYYHYKPEFLSGGQQQRAAIARAIAHNPSIIIADEPTANLDMENGSKVLDYFLNACKGKDVIISTHNEAIRDRIDKSFSISKGKVFAL